MKRSPQTTMFEQWTQCDMVKPIHNGTPTSVDAARAISPSAATIRGRVLDCIRGCGTRGATRVEIEIALNLSGNTVRPRVRELEVQGLVTVTDQTRLTPSGRKAAVIIARDQ